MLLTALSMLYHLFRAAVTGRVMSLDLTKFTTYLRTKNQQLKRREIDGSLTGANNARPHTSTMLYTVETPSPVEPSRVKYYRKHFGSRFRATFLILYKSDGMANIRHLLRTHLREMRAVYLKSNVPFTVV